MSTECAAIILREIGCLRRDSAHFVCLEANIRERPVYMYTSHVLRLPSWAVDVKGPFSKYRARLQGQREDPGSHAHKRAANRVNFPPPPSCQQSAHFCCHGIIHAATLVLLTRFHFA